MKVTLAVILLVLVSIGAAQAAPVAAPVGGFYETLGPFDVFGYYDPDTYQVRNIDWLWGANHCYVRIMNYRREVIQEITMTSTQVLPETIYYPQLYCLSVFNHLDISSIYKIPIRYTYISSVKSPSGSYIPETTPYP